MSKANIPSNTALKPPAQVKRSKETEEEDDEEDEEDLKLEDTDDGEEYLSLRNYLNYICTLIIFIQPNPKRHKKKAKYSKYDIKSIFVPQFLEGKASNTEVILQWPPVTMRNEKDLHKAPPYRHVSHPLFYMQFFYLF